jgi:site-specific recombinase XerD
VIKEHQQDNMQKSWRHIRLHAELRAVHIYDPRHTFASHGLAMGQGLPSIVKLLSHPQTTARFVHLAADPAIEVADKISERLANGLNPISFRLKNVKAV